MLLKVLIADDEKAPRELLKNKLPWKELGISQVFLAEDGEEAVQISKIEKPDIIISDIKMPRLNGIGLAEEIKKIIPEAFFVFLSAYPDKEYLKDAIRLKATRFVEKPIDLEEIEELLRELVAESHNKKREDPKFLFFYGENASSSLNGTVCVIHAEEYEALHNLASFRDFEGLKKEAELLLTRLGSSDGTDIEYVRNAFSRMVISILDAAEVHSVTSVTSLKSKLLYETSRSETFIELKNAILSLIDLYKNEIKMRSMDLSERVDKYLSAHFHEKELTVQMVADDLGFVNTYLCMAYKKNCGKTVNQKLTELRIEKARELLCQTGYKLYEIADKVGYHDPQYFTKVFTKESGVSPRKYREEHNDLRTMFPNSVSATEEGEKNVSI